MTTHQRTLLRLMEEYNVNSRYVGRILHCHPITVRKWRNGTHQVPFASIAYLDTYLREQSARGV